MWAALDQCYVTSGQFGPVPLSKYLQTSGMDLFKAQQFVDATVKELQVIQRNIKAVEIKVSSFIEWGTTKVIQMQKLAWKNPVLRREFT